MILQFPRNILQLLKISRLYRIYITAFGIAFVEPLLKILTLKFLLSSYNIPTEKPTRVAASPIIPVDHRLNKDGNSIFPILLKRQQFTNKPYRFFKLNVGIIEKAVWKQGSIPIHRLAPRGRRFSSLQKNLYFLQGFDKLRSTLGVLLTFCDTKQYPKYTLQKEEHLVRCKMLPDTLGKPRESIPCQTKVM